MQNLKIKAIKKVNKQDRYDLTVPSTNNFFANNILIHNTSAVITNLLCKRELSFKDKIAKWFGAKVVETDYDNLYSSRKVLKNSKLNPNPQHYYGTDIWGDVNEELKPFVEAGISLYLEIVGYTKDGKAIQKGYEYGCKPNTHASYIYRITSTNVDGKVTEFTWEQVKGYCEKYGLVYVPELYVGKAIDLTNDEWYSKFDYQTDFEKDLLETLQVTFLNKKLPNGSPDEGICVRIEKGLESHIYKLKDFQFTLGETKRLDEGVIDLESSQS